MMEAATEERRGRADSGINETHSDGVAGCVVPLAIQYYLCANAAIDVN